ncbi:hypothetical protein HELRODRAFT_114532 [Helobdella robusta]|uniref:RRM domain-containing protein n=1 Tax=Helobdella robusta TaxID=6412 RepID=T1EG25_HELRO|nr:hypothetical protein HELRODRAFT_114532 [Helobdella robusta]ESN95932.1 hypothetical protein HELRODRAFT_114532 [Helobdella robusta]
MADDYEINDMLERPYKKKEEVKVRKHKRKSGHEERKKKKKKKEHRRSREYYEEEMDDEEERMMMIDEEEEFYEEERMRRHEKYRSRRRSRSPDRHHRSSPRYESPRRYELPPKKIKSDRSPREKSRERIRSRSRGRIRSRLPELTPEERDARTIFCMQLSTKLRPIDLKDFFGKLGKIRDVRLIMDNRSRRSKGIAYIEFQDTESVAKALELSGQRLLGVPIIIQPSHGERNRSNMPITTATGKPGSVGPMKLYIGSLHYNITEEMLKGIFEPFGPIDELKLMRDHSTGRSLGYGFLQFKRGDDGKKALEQLNGFELAGRPMKLGNVADYQLGQSTSTLFDADEVDKAGFGMNATSRIQLMAKLAEGTGFEIPKAAASVLNGGGGGVAKLSPTNQKQADAPAPPIATQCFLLSNMFTANELKDAEWERELKDDVIEECNKHGGVLHIHVDKTSAQGHVYVKCPSIASAMSSVNALHGRFFAGKQITAAYVPLPNYHNLFPESIRAVQFILPSNAIKSSIPYLY